MRAGSESLPRTSTRKGARHHVDLRQPKPAIVRAYSCCLALLPVLDLYSSPFPKVNLAQFVAAAFLLAAIISTLVGRAKGDSCAFQGNPWRPAPLLFAATLISASAFALIIVDGPASLYDAAARWSILVLWAASITVSSRIYFDFDITFRAMRAVTMGACAYLIVQFFAWRFTRTHIPPVWNNALFRPYGGHYTNAEHLVEHYEAFYVRPASFFGEPAYFAYYALATLAILLFADGHKNHVFSSLQAIFISVCIVLSTSTTGTYLLAMVWGIWLIRLSGHSRRFSGAAHLTLGTLFTAILLFVMSPRWFGTNHSYPWLQVLSKPLQWESSSRTGASYSLFNQLEGAQRFVGVGLGNEDVYLGITNVFYNDLTMVLLGTGWLGLVVFLTYLSELMGAARGGAKVLVLVYALTCLVEQHLYSGQSYLTLSLALYWPLHHCASSTCEASRNRSADLQANYCAGSARQTRNSTERGTSSQTSELNTTCARFEQARLTSA